MPDWLDCACGQQLRLPFPGGAKRARCPACKQVHALPLEEVVEAAPPPQPRSGWLVCECGKQIRLPLPGGAKRARCPTCQEVLDVPPEFQEDDDSPGTVGLAAAKQCPGCRQFWPESATVCDGCGYDFHLGLPGRVAKRSTKVLAVRLTYSGTETVQFEVRCDSRGRWWLTETTYGPKVVDHALADYEAVVIGYQGDYFRLELQGRKKSVEIWAGYDEEMMQELADLLWDGPKLAIRR